MKEQGTKLIGIEVGNAWALRKHDAPTNWIVGANAEIDPASLRYVKRGEKGALSREVSMKVFIHKPTEDNPAWGDSKPTSEGRTLSILAGVGEFELTFRRGEDVYTVTLDQPSDFAIWGSDLEHSWVPLKESTIVTLRWIPAGFAAD